MTDRILDLADKQVSVQCRGDLVVLRAGSEPEVTIAIEELEAVLASCPGVIFSLASLARLARANVPVVVCDERRMPQGMLLPLEGHSVQAERFATQAEVSLPTRKRLWADIVRAKVRAQSRLLSDLGRENSSLEALVVRVRSGDETGIEAQAARLYWPALLGPDFRRDREQPGANVLLNYGYTILRSAAARAVCGAGLHPSFGLHHHNRYDAFRLADDLMEPFRPMVDRVVERIVRERGQATPLDKTTKPLLVAILGTTVQMRRERRSLTDALSRCAASLAEVFEGKRRSLLLPAT